MLERKTLLSLNYYKKAVFTGGAYQMLYRVEKDGEELKATVWRGPWCYDISKKEDMFSEHFPFSEEGLQLAAEWINRQEKERKDYWETAPGLTD